MMEITQLFGLPAHPMFVHAAVVLLPLAGIATVVCAAVLRWRRPYAPLALALALAATVAVGLAQGSGEELEEQVTETELVEEHTESGETVLPWAIALTLAAAAVTGIPLATGRWPAANNRGVTVAIVVVSVIAAVGAAWTVIDVGHSGARATWDDVASGDAERS